MKMKNSGFRDIFVVIMIFVIYGFVSPLEGASSGGSGYPVTPYEYEDEITEKDVVKVKNISSMKRNIKYLPFKDANSIRYGQQIGLVYVKNRDDPLQPVFKFHGVTESGEEVVIDFSEIGSFSVIKVDNNLFSKDRVFLNIVVFPNITPKELVDINPSFSELEDKYKKNVRIWVLLEDNKKGELSFVRKRRSGDYEILGKLRDIKLNYEVDLGCEECENEDTLWWAIPSVIEDSKYPHRWYAGF